MMCMNPSRSRRLLPRWAMQSNDWLGAAGTTPECAASSAGPERFCFSGKFRITRQTPKISVESGDGLRSPCCEAIGWGLREGTAGEMGQQCLASILCQEDCLTSDQHRLCVTCHV